MVSLVIFVTNITFIDTLITYSSIYSGLIPWILVLLIKKKGVPYKILSFYLFFCVVSDLVLIKLSYKFFQSEVYSYRLFTIVEFCSIIFYVYYITNDVLTRRIIWTSITIFSLALVYDIVSNNSLNFDSIPTGIECISVILISILLIYNELRNSNIENLFNSEVIILIGFLIFFSGTFFLFILSQKNFYEKNFVDAYTYIVASFNIIKNIFLSIGISKKYNYSFTKRNIQNI